MKPLRIAVVGAGHLGRIHARLAAAATMLATTNGPNATPPAAPRIFSSPNSTPAIGALNAAESPAAATSQMSPTVRPIRCSRPERSATVVPARQTSAATPMTREATAARRWRRKGVGSVDALARHLSRRGFGSSAIFKVLKEMAPIASDEEGAPAAED